MEQLITLTDNGGYVTYSRAETDKLDIPKTGLTIRVNGDKVILTWPSFAGVGSLEIDYRMVLSPSVTDAVSLAKTISGWASSAVSSSESTILNPEWSHYTDPIHLVDFDSVGASTNRYIITGQGYKNFSLHWKLVTTDAGDTTTLTFWATNNSAADNTADTDWVDISTMVLGAASKSANNSTEEGMAFIDTDFAALKYMVKIVTTTGGTNTNAADVYVVKA